MSPAAWDELRASRFASLPEFCGDLEAPGIRDVPEGRDWTERQTTEDQQRIERYLDACDLSGARILHIGVGNSGLAQRFHRRVKEIVGTTIVQRELDRAQELKLGNYSVLLHNKYQAEPEQVGGAFDFIIDNNPNSFCCCFRHLKALFGFYREKLAQNGQILTDRQGLAWVVPGGFPALRLSFEDLAAVAAASNLKAFKATRNVYVVTRAEAPAASSPSFFRQAAARVRILLSGRAAKPSLNAVD